MGTSSLEVINLLLKEAKAPWSWGRMHDILSCILSEGARSNPVANYEERETSERKIEIGNEKRKKKEGAPANDQ